MQHMDTVCNPHRIDGAIGVAPMILDQLVDARPQPLPRLGARCAPKLDHNSATPTPSWTALANCLNSRLPEPPHTRGRSPHFTSISIIPICINATPPKPPK